jgi:serine/threonine protein kinase
VQVHDIDPDGEYIVMELVKGEALSSRIKRERKLPPSEVRRIGAALLEALGAAHAAGIVHRDVKPANVLLGEKGEVKLSDFGVAFFGDSSLTMPGTRIGTPAYMAPEQLRARHVDARAACTRPARRCSRRRPASGCTMTTR